MKKESQKIYQAALYLRLSSQNLNEETGESDSIVNQEALIRSYLKSHSDIRIKHIFKDDGFTGVNFNRPGFQKMMQKIYDNEVDCVVVKDLSRLGRNHTETGKYITRVFPAFGVRFIAVNDNVDTANGNSDMDSIIIPFKDLLNDSYSRDISMKIRSAKSVMNAAGNFGGAFYPYGYLIDPENPNHYVIDEEAKEVVKKIYRWTFDGIGSSEVVRRLNDLHIPAPSEHKKKAKQGDKYVPGNHKWNIYQVYRILRNDVYIGTLRLGKTTTPNYKVKKLIHIPEEEQFVFEDAHTPIIPKGEFEMMQELLTRDIRVCGKGGNYTHVYPLSGYVFCADCGGSMVVKTTTSKGKQYRYYVCGENKKNSKVCSPHSIPFQQLNDVVLKLLNAHIKLMMDVNETMDDESIRFLTKLREDKTQIQIGKMLEEKYRTVESIKNLYDDYKEGILTEDEYLSLKTDYQNQRDELDRKATALQLENRKHIEKQLDQLHWICDYQKSGELTRLTRRDVVAFIDRIEVRSPEDIKIKYRFGEEYKKLHKKRMERRKEAVNG